MINDHNDYDNVVVVVVIMSTSKLNTVNKTSVSTDSSSKGPVSISVLGKETG
jgi:hypothetical protein